MSVDDAAAGAGIRCPGCLAGRRVPHFLDARLDIRPKWFSRSETSVATVLPPPPPPSCANSVGLSATRAPQASPKSVCSHDCLSYEAWDRGVRCRVGAKQGCKWASISQSTRRTSTTNPSPAKAQPPRIRSHIRRGSLSLASACSRGRAECVEVAATSSRWPRRRRWQAPPQLGLPVLVPIAFVWQLSPPGRPN